MILPYFKYIKDNFLKTVFLFFLSSVLCSLGLFCVNHYIGFYHRLDVYRYYGLDKGILYTPEYGTNIFDVSDERAEEVLDKINSLDGVRNADYLYWTSSLIVEDVSSGHVSSSIDVIPLSDCEQSLPWKIIKGKEPQSTNELLVTSNFMGLYDVGDEIKCKIYGSDSKGNSIFEAGDFIIVGFFDEDSYMPPTDEYTFRDAIGLITGVTPFAYAFAKQVKADNGNLVFFDKYYDCINVTPRSYSDIEKLKKEIPEIIGRGTAYDFNHYVDLCYNDNKVVNDMVNVFFVAMAVLTISVLVSYTIIQLSVFKRDMVVYFLEGCTWKRAIGISCFATLPAMLLGMVSGILIYRFASIYRDMTNGSYIFTGKAIVIVCSAIILVYFLLVGLFYLYASRQSPIETIRSE